MKRKIISLILGVTMIGMVGCNKANHTPTRADRIVVAQSDNVVVVHLDDNNEELINLEVEFLNGEPLKVFVDNIMVDGKPIQIEDINIIKQNKVLLQIAPINGKNVEC